jgi:LmbE family N-acetylglucosaminyl deacetylase
MHYAAAGYRVVLVTCTDGQLGFDRERRAGPDPRHDVEETRSTRAGELRRAASVAGFDRVVTLGFDDSGMAGWPQNSNPTAFMNASVDASAQVLAALFDEMGATVVVTYDENGFYGHPDHIMANTVTRRAIELSHSPQRLYYPVVPQSVLSKFIPDATAGGVFLPQWLLEAGVGIADELVTTTLDVTRFASSKQAAIAAHASQIDNADLVTMDSKLFTLLFGVEYYQRAWSRGPVSGDETDLFGGLRD